MNALRHLFDRSSLVFICVALSLHTFSFAEMMPQECLRLSCRFTGLSQKLATKPECIHGMSHTSATHIHHFRVLVM